jgi:hypothetical protein
MAEYHKTIYRADKYKKSQKYLVDNEGHVYIKEYKESIMTPIDKHIIEYRMERSRLKMQKNIANILKNISKLKNNPKKYQISGYHEWKILNKKLGEIKYIEYSLVIDEKLEKNVVSEIIGGYYSGCCYECDGRPTYIQKKFQLCIYGLEE